MLNEPNPSPPKRPRGRPPGPPKPPKPPAKIGRPTVWDPAHGPSQCKGVTAPKAFFEAWKDFSFRAKISKLMIDEARPQ